MKVISKSYAIDGDLVFSNTYIPIRETMECQMSDSKTKILGM